MTILHFACVRNCQHSGICLAVPQHVVAQGKIENVGFVNLNKEAKYDEIENQLEYDFKKGISGLPSPFCDPDIVIFHGLYIPQFIKIYKELLKKKIPYIIIPHGSMTKMAQRKKILKKQIGNLLMFNAFVKKASGIQYLSQGEKELSVFKGVSFISPNGVFIPEKSKKEFRDNETKIVYIGRMDINCKGIDLMLNAVNNLSEFLREKKVKFFLYGPDENQSYSIIQNYIENNALTDLVALRDGVYKEEKEKVLLDADMFIQTSRYEGMPLGVVEALSYGLPCIVTNETNFGEYIDKNNCGWSCEANEESIIATIKTAVNEMQLCKDKSINARKSIIRDYSWEKVSFDAIKSYCSILKHNQGDIHG